MFRPMTTAVAAAALLCLCACNRHQQGAGTGVAPEAPPPPPPMGPHPIAHESMPKSGLPPPMVLHVVPQSAAKAAPSANQHAIDQIIEHAPPPANRGG